MTLQSYPSSSDWNPIFFHFYICLFFILSSTLFPFFHFSTLFSHFHFIFSLFFSHFHFIFPLFSHFWHRLSAFGDFAIKKVLHCYFWFVKTLLIAEALWRSARSPWQHNFENHIHAFHVCSDSDHDSISLTNSMDASEQNEYTTHSKYQLDNFLNWLLWGFDKSHFEIEQARSQLDDEQQAAYPPKPYRVRPCRLRA